MSDGLFERAKVFLTAAEQTTDVEIFIRNGVTYYEQLLRSAPELVRDLVTAVTEAREAVGVAQRSLEAAEVSNPREALARVISDHQLTGRYCIGCTGCPDLVFETSVDHAEHVADMIGMQFLTVPQGEVVGLEYGWRGDPEWSVVPVESADEARDFASHSGTGEALFHPVLAWSPLPENGEQP
ncbi:hypothetical protein [Nocardia sp. Marseille-Q1738]